MKKILTGILISLMALVLANFAIGAVTDEESVAASVTVNTFISITLTDAGNGGFAFGSLDPGTENEKEADQTDGAASVDPAATVTNDAISNVNADVKLKGTDFTSGDTLPITNVAYDDDGAVDEGTDTGPLNQSSLTTSYPGSAFVTLTPGSNVDIWFWLDVPTSQAAGAYTSTFSFEGS